MSDQAAAIIVTTVRCQTMADGTLRLTLDAEPNDAEAAFKAFGRPGVAAALARLTDEAAKTDMQERVTKTSHPHSDFATHLFRHGFFNIPKVRELLGAIPDNTQDDVKERLKHAMREEAYREGIDEKFESLADIPPWLIKRWAKRSGVVFTFLKTEQ